MPLYEDPPNGFRMAAAPLQRWTQALVERLGTPADVAADVAEVLVARRLRSNGAASSVTVASPLASRARMARRVGSARAAGQPRTEAIASRMSWRP